LIAVALAFALACLCVASLALWERHRLRLQLAEVAHRLTGSDAPSLGELVGLIDRQAARLAEMGTIQQQRSDRVRLALDSVPMGVVVADAAGTVVHRNEPARVERELGHTGALVESALEEVLADALAGRAAERQLQLFGPPRRSLVVRASPLLHEGRSLGSVAVIEDLTDRERLAAMRRDFIANVSHELKTPIGAIGLLAETLLGEPDDEVRDRLLERTNAEAMRVARIIDDLLDLSAIEYDEDAQRAAVAVAEVINTALERVGETAALRETKLRAAEGAEDLLVLGDRRQLVRALVNLLENSIKYSPEGSEVVIETARTLPGFVELAVKDSGIGIPARDLNRIFERFYRVDQARSRASGGTGLGLSIVSHVARNHGGQVLVDSREGEGSTFTLRLPLHDERGDLR
jgi:two-component system, OmpR family, sensor histidine kinase SenX3